MSGMDRDDRDFLDARFATVTEEIRGLRDVLAAKHAALEERVGRVEEKTDNLEKTGASRLWAVVVAGIAAGLGALIGTATSK